MSMRLSCSIACVWLACAALAPASDALLLMDQIGPDGSFQQGLSNNSTQISNFYASAPQYDIAVADDFTLSEPAILSTVEAALFASNASVGFGQITALRVNLFSTQPSAVNVMVGDVLSHDIPISQVSLTSPWTTSTLTALASVDLSASALLLSPGTYWLSVVALNNSFSTDFGVLMSSFAGTPGDDDARQVGSGLWGGGGDRALNADAAFRVNGAAVPEPSTALLFGAGMVLLARRRVRWHQAGH
jgi:hypothetical protein